jgi:cyclopropane-fatty-acyl-phospholipid synthase
MLTSLAEKGRLPDSAIRLGIRRLLARNLVDREGPSLEAQHAAFRRFVADMRRSPIAINTREANEQHYELPPAFFMLCLGPRLKYSSAYFDKGVRNLGRAEMRMLALTCERADLADEQHILELGCGWGSLTLWMAEKYPKATITAVSNSVPQREFILARAREKGFNNVTVLTRDMNRLSLPEASFDRVVSVEMFEHMRNWPKLLGRIAQWTRPGAQLFIHIFVHRDHAYPFEPGEKDDWMSRYFFTGGIMPSDHLLYRFQDHWNVQGHWRVDGRHYEKTANAWLANHDAHGDEIMELMRETYGKKDALMWYHRWRIFWMACAELWGYREGREWFVSHYRLARRT